MSYAKLICEAESLCVIEGSHTPDEIKRMFVEANMSKLYGVLARAISEADFIAPHNYRFKIQVHAQVIEDNLTD